MWRVYNLHHASVFTYSHANTPLGQSERAYYLSYFINIYIYIYIYIYPFTKTLVFQKYISYIFINTEERLKQGGHTLHQPRGVTITYNFCF